MESEPAPAAHLSSWGRQDSVLLLLGILGLWCFLAWRNSLLAGSPPVLELDAVTARREAQELTKRLGHDFTKGLETSTELQYRPQQHNLSLLDAYIRQDAVAALRGVEFPLYWKTEWKPGLGPAAPFLPVLMPGLFSENYVLVDRRGKPKEFQFTQPFRYLAADYRPPSNQERREMARKAVEEICGAIPRRMVREDAPGGEAGASYSAISKWRYEDTVFAEIAFVEDRVTRLNCEPYAAPETMAVRLAPLVYRGLFWGLAILVLLRALARLLFLFGSGRCQSSPLLWRRLPLAVLLGVTGAWVVAPALLASPPSVPVRLLLGLSSSGLFLVALVAVEDYLRRRTPGGVATYALALRGHFRDPAVCLAVVRGALGGLILGGLETLLASLGRASMALDFHSLQRLLLSGVLDPTPIGYALTSFSPALFVVSSACFHALWLGVILLGLGRADSFAPSRSPDRLDTLWALNTIPRYAWIGIAGLPLHTGVFLGGLGGFFYPAILALALGWLLFRYDLLTAVVAVATVTLWDLNYPLLQVLRDIGNGSHWAVLAGWAAVVLFAAMTAFQTELRQYLRRG